MYVNINSDEASNVYVVFVIWQHGERIANVTKVNKMAGTHRERMEAKDKGWDDKTTTVGNGRWIRKRDTRALPAFQLDIILVQIDSALRMR